MARTSGSSDSESEHMQTYLGGIWDVSEKPPAIN
jgi:hypothetical protein